jgi:hypothetical protein
LARLLDEHGGVFLHAWVPAADQLQDSRRAGWTLGTTITSDTPADGEGSVLNCWRGHAGLWIDAAECRRVVVR